ncbi:MAG: ABC transporter substrate-binding protein [Promethearchaeota archaeon]
MNITKSKAILIAAVVIIAGLTVGGYYYINGQNKKYDVRIGYLEGDLHQLAFYVAHEEGFYADEGLTIDSIAFANGGDVMVDFESASRTIDMAYLGFAPAVYHRFNNLAANITVLAGVNVNGTSLIVRNDSVIQSASDLNGLTIAVPARNNMQDFILSMILDLANMTHANITTVIQSPPEMVLALNARSIDGYVAWEPYCVKGLDAGGKYLYNSSQVWTNHPCCVIASHNDFLKTHSDIAQKILKVHKRATEWIWNHPAETQQIAMDKMNLSQDQAIKAMANIGYVYGVDISQMELFIEKMVNLNDQVSLDSPNIPVGLDAAGFINWFCKQLPFS